LEEVGHRPSEGTSVFRKNTSSEFKGYSFAGDPDKISIITSPTSTASTTLDLSYEAPWLDGRTHIQPK